MGSFGAWLSVTQTQIYGLDVEWLAKTFKTNRALGEADPSSPGRAYYAGEYENKAIKLTRQVGYLYYFF